ncbi:MAG: FAD-dependent oxidoreductase [Phreatobacter sp.]|uniref:FAD-dependent oxidoreductase n=1 Tax=Phreatobacter sp. TaxID=1966341 RepID=UPI001A48AA1D|nr:FAD-dependent oxidoreductase [Phreatobacter sp.]MBL8571830.1 FAD-dependent oxidoreductase [Phreatobacter sp.]
MRLVHPAFEPARPAVTFTYDGRPITAYEGESIAAALSAAGVLALRHTRNGARRGLWCGMGACFECLVTIDGRASQRACLAKASEGLVVTSAPPAGQFAALAPPAGETPAEHEVDVLVVGAGPAGLAAATEAARHLPAPAGAPRVVVLDERPAPGGQYFKQLADTHRFTGERFADRQFRDGADLIRAARAAGAGIVSEAGVWAAFAPDEIGVLVAGRATIFKPRQLILAAGAYERPVPIPGWTLPGVMTTGAVQTLARAYRVAPGRRLIIAGNGPLNLQTAVELIAGGAQVVAVAEEAPAPGPSRLRALGAMAAAAPDLAFDGARLLATLRSRGVPVLWGHRVVAAEGDGGFARARMRGPDGRERTLDADILALGHGFVPATELARMLGLRHRFVDRHVGYMAPVVDADGRASIASVYVVGDGAEMGGARVARARGTLAGHAAATAILGSAPDDAARRARRDLARAEAFQRALWTVFAVPDFDVAALADDVTVCRCEDLTAGRIRAEIRTGATAMGAIKKLARAGMGRCQGRNCAAAIARLLHAETGAPLDEFAFFAPRAPARPVPVGALAFEKPEWGGHKALTPPPPVAARAARTRSETAHRTDVLVIGGGVLGSCTAYYLAREGADVLVAERDEINLQASGANAGSLHVQLLSFDFGSKAEAGGGPAAQTLALGPDSVRLWQAIERDTGVDCEIRVTGGLMVAETDRQLGFLREKVALENRHGIDAQVIDAAELRRLSPNLSPRFVGAELCPMEGKINPLTATYAAARGAMAAGARFLAGAEVRAIARDGSGFVATTSAGTIRAGRIVVAAGAWSPRVSAMLGIELPVRGAPLQMIVTEPAPKLIDHLVAHADRHLTMKQLDAGGLLIGGGWTAAADMTTGVSRTLRASIEGNLWVAQRVLPALEGLHVLRSWAAMNVNIDGAPIIGEAPGVPGLFHAVTSTGYTLAPIVGRITADLIRTGRTGRDISAFTLDRFG